MAEKKKSLSTKILHGMEDMFNAKRLVISREEEERLTKKRNKSQADEKLEKTIAFDRNIHREPDEQERHFMGAAKKGKTAGERSNAAKRVKVLMKLRKNRSEKMDKNKDKLQAERRLKRKEKQVHK